MGGVIIGRLLMGRDYSWVEITHGWRLLVGGDYSWVEITHGWSNHWKITHQMPH